MEEFGGLATKQELVDYLQRAIALETDVSTQEMIVREYEGDSDIRKPHYLEIKEPKKPEQPQYSSYFDERVYVIFGAVIMLMGILFLFFPLMGDDAGFKLAAFFGVVFLIWGPIWFFPNINKARAKKQENERLAEKYDMELKNYRTKLEEVKQKNDRNRSDYQGEMSEWERSKSLNMVILSSHITETKSLLDSFYSLNYIYPKYRNLPALTSICEYFQTGRCDSLIGPHGAYNLFEDEVRKDTVISQLSAVIENLEQVRKNQYLLYQQVSMIQKEAQSVASDLKQIKGHTASIKESAALNAYYAEATARNTEISAAYHTLNG